MRIGFIGLGNMAGAMIGGILGKGLYTKEQIVGSAKTEETAAKIKEKYGIETYTDNTQVAKQADVIVLAVKPIFFSETRIFSTSLPLSTAPFINSLQRMSELPSLRGLPDKIKTFLPIIITSLTVLTN